MVDACLIMQHKPLVCFKFTVDIFLTKNVCELIYLNCGMHNNSFNEVSLCSIT